VCVCVYTCVYVKFAMLAAGSLSTALILFVCMCACVCVCAYVRVYVCICVCMYNSPCWQQDRPLEP